MEKSVKFVTDNSKCEQLKECTQALLSLFNRYRLALDSVQLRALNSSRKEFERVVYIPIVEESARLFGFDLTAVRDINEGIEMQRVIATRARIIYAPYKELRKEAAPLIFKANALAGGEIDLSRVVVYDCDKWSPVPGCEEYFEELCTYWVTPQCAEAYKFVKNNLRALEKLLPSLQQAAIFSSLLVEGKAADKIAFAQTFDTLGL